MKKVKDLIFKILILYFVLSIAVILIGILILNTYANEMRVLKSQYKAVLQENRELKKRIGLNDLDNTDVGNIDSATQLPISTPTETYLIVPAYSAGNQDSDLEPFADNSESSTHIELFGTKYNKYLGVIDLDEFFCEPMTNTYTPSIASFPSCLPGAPRSYRNGYHQGTDYYSMDCGSQCKYGQNVFAVACGEIVRIDHDYLEMDTTSRNLMLDKMAEIVADPNRDLDTDLEYQKYFDLVRGRQVIIDHGNGLYSDYCHLSGVNEGLDVGSIVPQGEIVGYLGNSGTSKGAQDFDTGYVIGLEYNDNPTANQMNMIGREWHLHLEYWYCPQGLDDPLAKTNYLEWNTVKKLYGY